MKISSGFRDLLRSLNTAGVRYLIVGGCAVMVHNGAPLHQGSGHLGPA
jgi:hypothetical protein